MAAKFHPRPTWGTQDRKLTLEALVLQDYLGRCPTRTSEGLFQLSLGYVSVDTPLIDEEIRAAFKELSKAGLYDYDEDNELVLDRSALRINPLRNGADKKTGEVKVDKRIPNAVGLFQAMPESTLKIEFMALADVYTPDLADAIRAESTYSYIRPIGAPSEDHRRTIEGPSRDEKRRVEERQSRDEVHQLEPIDDEDQDLQSAVDLVRQELSAEEVRYGTGGEEQW